MSNELVPAPVSLPAVSGPTSSDVAKVVEILLGAPNEHTRRGYATDLAAYAGWACVPRDEALASLVALGPLEGHVQVTRYRESLTGSGLSPGSVNRRLTTLRTWVKLAKTLGLSTWALELRGLKTETYRDTRGPGTEVVKAMIEAADADAVRGGRVGREGRRDALLVRLMFTLGLRRGEVSGLDLVHVDLRQDRLWIHGKGRGAREAVSIASAGLRTRLDAWVAERRATGAGDEDPLFVNMERGSKGKPVGTARLTGGGIWHAVVRRSTTVGQRSRPHGLRHSAITESLARNNGNVRATQKFSRHKRVETVLLYDDSRRDHAGEAARDLSEVLGDE